MTATLEGTQETRTPLVEPVRDLFDPAAGTPCARRGCYAHRDGYPHSYYEQTEDLHGIRVAESAGRRRGLSETWPDCWSVRLEATGDEPWRVEVIVHAKTWPERKAAYCAFSDYSIPDAVDLAAGIAKAERMRKRLSRLAESEGSR